MRRSAKVLVVTQHYPPDPTTTAAIMAEIAIHLAGNYRVLVLSGSAGSAPDQPLSSARPEIVEIKNRLSAKGALVRRAAAELLFTLRAFAMVSRRARRGDLVLTVTTPFMLPYAMALAARLRGVKSALIIHDLYPDVLVMSGLLKPASLVARSMRVANRWMFRMLDAVITIGRDTARMLQTYRVSSEKIHFIPNWATLAPAVRPLPVGNPFRPRPASFVVGLSGNLGFTHDPVIVFEAARLLRNDPQVEFLLSGWGVGFERLKQMQAEANLPNATLLDRVGDEDLEKLLTAADIWLIPYRKNAAGVSVPSRLYNLLAVGRPVIVVCEPESEAALTVLEHNLGWVVMPDRPDELARAIKVACSSVDPSMAERAVATARTFNRDRAMAGYAGLVEELLGS